MASSPRIIVSKVAQQNLSPRPGKNTLNVNKSLSPRTPNNLSPHSLLLSFSVDTPNKSKILDNQLSPYQKKQSVLGCGGFGTVYKASYHGNPVAVKIIKREKRNDATVEAEKNATTLHHTNIVKILGIEQGIACSLITMELCGKTLQDKLEETKLKKNERIDIWRTIASALEFCHNAGIIHGDVKPKNILVSVDDEIKLADFGSSITIKQSQKNKPKILEIHGTPGYVAPEVIKGNLPGVKSDIYSLGILSWQLLSQVSPFSGFHAHTILFLSGKGDRPFDGDIDDEFNGNYKELYRASWSNEAEERPTIKIILSKLEELSKIK